MGKVIPHKNYENLNLKKRYFTLIHCSFPWFGDGRSFFSFVRSYFHTFVPKVQVFLRLSSRKSWLFLQFSNQKSKIELFPKDNYFLVLFRVHKNPIDGFTKKIVNDKYFHGVFEKCLDFRGQGSGFPLYSPKKTII